mgnify:CR=1 FL=1
MAAWSGGRHAVFLLMVILSVPPATMGAEVGLPPDKLPIVAGDHPRVFFFRQTESFARGKRMPYDDWDACFSRLLGIMGKALDEEIPGTIPDNIDYFARFKDRHPDQAVLLHYSIRAYSRLYS